MTARVLYLCTGNAARSVMATVMTRDRAPHLDVRGAGTMSIPDLPMSQRTRNALRGLGHIDATHRSRQLEASDAVWADVIVTFEPHHISYVRRHHPTAAWRTASMPRLVRDLRGDGSDLADRLGALGLADVEPEAWEEVVDPAGGEQDVFEACCAQISLLVDELVPLLAGDRVRR